MGTARDELTAAVIGSAIEVHRVLGRGLFETVYEECLCWELERRALAVRRQAAAPVVYKDNTLDASYRIDLLVEEKLVVEVKAVERALPVHDAQILTYMKMSGASVTSTAPQRRRDAEAQKTRRELPAGGDWCVGGYCYWGQRGGEIGA